MRATTLLCSIHLNDGLYDRGVVDSIAILRQEDRTVPGLVWGAGTVRYMCMPEASVRAACLGVCLVVRWVCRSAASWKNDDRFN